MFRAFFIQSIIFQPINLFSDTNNFSKGYFMKILHLILATLTSMAISAPIPLRDNSNRIWNRDPLFNHNSENKSAFLSVHNFSFQAVNRYTISDDSTISGNRLLILLADSLRYKALSANIEGFYDQRGIYGQNIEWSDPDLPNMAPERSGFDLHRATLNFEPASWVKISVGKEQHNWGPLQLGGLMLSDWNAGFTGLSQQYRIGPFVIRSLATQLNSTPWGYGKDFSSLKIEHRFFSASRIEFYRERFGIALAQSSIYAGEGRTFELPYLIPVYPFHYAQMSNWRYGNEGDNSYGGFDGYVNFLDKQLKLYGEAFVDDFQGESDAGSQSVQNNVAGIAGMSWDIKKKAYGFIEGGQINSLVYNHISGYKLRYQSKNALIGSPLGPDQKLLWGSVGYRIRPELTVDLTGWYRESGEKDINIIYTSVAGSRDDEIPFGIVEKETSGWATAKYNWKGISAELNGGIVHTKNVDHVENSESTEPFFGILVKTGINLNWKNNPSEE